MPVNVRDKTYTGDFATLNLSDTQISTLRAISVAGGRLPYNELDKTAATYLCQNGVDMAYKKMYKPHNSAGVYSVCTTDRGEEYLRYIDAEQNSKMLQIKLQRVGVNWSAIACIAAIAGVIVAIVFGILSLQPDNVQSEPPKIQTNISDGIIDNEDEVNDGNPVSKMAVSDEPRTDAPEETS